MSRVFVRLFSTRGKSIQFAADTINHQKNYKPY